MARSLEFLFPFACFECRRSFKRGYEPGVAERPCPACGRAAYRLDRKFKPPPRNDIKQWQKVRFLYEHGFRFQSVPHVVPGQAVPYPETLAEARLFVQRFRDHNED
jgi:hypothetical protein